ncbi:MAG: extracellular solute-binding protein, partial [Deltaproteobacteria bacterium]|nr:extracellular solute-binding protein [Deltaproteobacteria bacterium]
YDEAKRDGSLVLYTSLNVDDSQPLVEAFSARYPGIKVDVNRQGSSTLVTKILTERRVGKKDNADLVLTGADSLDLMLMETPTIFQKYASAERPPEERGLYSGVYFTILTIAYNSRAVTGADVPKRYNDLLRDRWKGKAAINLNNYGWIYAMLDFFGADKGMDFLRKFAALNPRPGRGTTLMVQQWLGGAEVEVALPLNHDGIKRFTDKGLPVDWARLDDPLYADLHTIGVLGMASRANAARLFVDFVLSKEGQTVMAKTGNSVLRDDISVKDEIDRRKLRFLSAQARAGADKHQKLMNELFSK